MPPSTMESPSWTTAGIIIGARVNCGLGRPTKKAATGTKFFRPRSTVGQRKLPPAFILDTKTAEPIEMLHFSMSLPVAVVITGIDRQEVLDQALAAVKTYRPMDKAAVAELLGRTRAAANKGQSELYKTSWHFDGTAQNPDWLGLKEE